MEIGIDREGFLTTGATTTGGAVLYTGAVNSGFFVFI